MTTAKSTVAGGVMLIGIGMLILTGWWWPGIMLVIGCAVAAERYIQGQVWQAITSFILFLAIPVGIAVAEHIDIPWHLAGPFVLIALGLVVIARNVLGRR